ncbi:hypothetical protein D3C78_1573010 [compost metagenome]
MRLAVEGVPQDEADRGADHQQHEGADLAHRELGLVVQIHQRGDQAEQDEHFVQVGDRDAANVRRDQVALVPAGEQAGQREHRRRPGQAAAHAHQQAGAGEGAGPVQHGGKEEQRAHPHERRLAG